MKIGKLLTLFAFCQLATTASADIVLKATYIEKGVEVEKAEDFTANAPLYVEFTSNPSDLDTGATIEWHISNTSRKIPAIHLR